MSHDWISADEPPPKHPEPHRFVRVIVYVPELDRGDTGSNGVCVGRYIHALDEWRVEGSPSSWRVTHWQPLPQPPEEA